MKAIILVVGAWFLLAPAASADEQPVTLKNAPGRDAVEGNCGSCHSLDYIQTNSPFPSAALWDAEVKKMMNVFGAPIAPADAKTITDYLVKNYGS
ncbi:MAG: cytochrome c [Proteobacteria bacterium]|nr:cytochrome c [Pseudomonadota bacterium]